VRAEVTIRRRPFTALLRKRHTSDMRRVHVGVCLLAAGLTLAARASDSNSITERHLKAIHISTSSWKPGDPGADALLRDILRFTREGCPTFGGHNGGVVWPAGYTSGTRPNGEHVVVTADGREIASGDTVVAGGGIGDAAPSGMPCVRRARSPRTSSLRSASSAATRNKRPHTHHFRADPGADERARRWSRSRSMRRPGNRPGPSPPS
jgi:hypothetical protein